MEIREAKDKNINEVLSVEKSAFGYDKEAELVNDLLNDKTAEPRLSLLGFDDGKAIGHILYTKVIIKEFPDTKMSILAPLAVVPEKQKQGVGGELIVRSLEILTKSGVDLVFVLGHPEYYPKFGFKTAGELGFEAPYHIPEEHAEAWMVQELKPGVIGSVKGKIKCSVELNKPEHWRE